MSSCYSALIDFSRRVQDTGLAECSNFSQENNILENHISKYRLCKIIFQNIDYSYKNIFSNYSVQNMCTVPI